MGCKWQRLSVFVACISGACCLVKTWAPSTSLTDPASWNPPRTSFCDQDQLVLPAGVVASLSSSLKFQTLVLPLNGEIVLNEGASLEVSSGQSNCQGQDHSFSAEKKHHWWKPTNWVHASPNHLAGRPGVLPGVEVIPHADRVPCPQDDAIVPNGTAFRMVLEETAIVHSLTINGQNMDTYSFSKYVSSASGRRAVSGGGQVQVTGGQDDACSQPSGCSCDNALDPTLYLICQSVGACPQTPCSDPVLPEGFCCPLCSSLVNFHYGDGFRLDALRDKFRALLTQDQLPVSCYLSKRRAGLVQAVCQDEDIRTGIEHSRLLSLRVRDLVLQDSSLGVSRMELVSSLKWLPDQSQSPGASAGLIVGLFIFFLLLIVSAMVTFYYYRKKRMPGFDFIRFDRGVAKVEMQLGTTPHEELQPHQDVAASSSSRRAFFNPIYEKEPPVIEKRNPDTRENPLYGLDEATDK